MKILTLRTSENKVLINWKHYSLISIIRRTMGNISPRASQIEMVKNCKKIFQEMDL